MGMTQIFDASGVRVPVTVIEAGPCVVLQRKTVEQDGFVAVPLGYLDQKESRLSKAEAGHCKKAGVSAKRIIREVKLEKADSDVKVGDSFTVSVFDGVGHVDVIATSKGRGFQGVVKRHGMSGGRASHGSGMHRRMGSAGMCVTPARILKGKRMPGRMGGVRRTVQNVKVVQVREEDNLLLVRGAIPGPTGGLVFVRQSLKKAGKSA